MMLPLSRTVRNSGLRQPAEPAKSVGTKHLKSETTSNRTNVNAVDAMKKSCLAVARCASPEMFVNIEKLAKDGDPIKEPRIAMFSL